jgi:hypothetical protein
MSCPAPFETLARWWLDDLPDADSTALEEHLFACDTCSAASESLADLVSGLRAWIPPVISHAQRERLARQGKKIRLNPVQAGADSHARFDRDLDLLVHVLRGNLSRAERVDLEIGRPDMGWRIVLENVPFDARAGEVLVACQRHYRDMFPGDPVFKVMVVERGERRPLGDYFVIHEWM